MRKNGVTAFSFVMISFLLSCSEDESTVPFEATTPALKEIHFNFETGEKIAEKIFTYDHQGNLVREYFDNLKNPINNFEIVNEFDQNGRLIKQMQGYPNSSEQYFTKIFTYTDEMKNSEEDWEKGKLVGKTLLFYTQNRVDSAQIFTFNLLEEGLRLTATLFYAYDQKDRVLEEYVKYPHGTFLNKTYQYEGDNLIQSCLGDNYECLRNEFDVNGNLFRVYLQGSSLPETKLQQELFYERNLLKEKMLYSYPVYVPGKTVEITLIQFEY